MKTIVLEASLWSYNSMLLTEVRAYTGSNNISPAFHLSYYPSLVQLFFCWSLCANPFKKNY